MNGHHTSVDALPREGSDDSAVLEFDSEDERRADFVRSPDPLLVDPTLAPSYAATTRHVMPVPARSRARRGVGLVLVLGLGVAFAGGFMMGQWDTPTSPDRAVVGPPGVVAPPALERLTPDAGVSRLLALGPVPVGPDAPVPPSIGQLVVRSTPAGAAVVLDGVLRGTTPLALTRLPLGQRTVQVAFGGYDMRQRLVVLSSERPSGVVDLQLFPAGSTPPRPAREPGHTGAVQVFSNPAGARLFVDDALVGTVPLLMPGLDPGSHRLRLELDGFRSWSASVLIESDQRFRIDATLVRSAFGP